MKRSVLGYLLLLLVFVSTSLADVVPVNLQLITPNSTYNTATLSASGTVKYIITYTATDNDTATATGNMLTKLTLTTDPDTRQVTSVSGLEFTGGLIQFSNVDMSLDFVIGTVEASGTGIKGTFDTPNPPKPVVNGTFQAIDHKVTLNQGRFDYHGTGTVADLVPSGSVNLASNPITPEIDEEGTLTVSLKSIDVYDATYEALLTLPLEFDQEIYRDSGTTGSWPFEIDWSVVANVAGSGTLRSKGTFTLTAPWIPGDANLDGEVDENDAARLAANWLQAGGWTQGNFNGDNVINEIDASILAANWGSSLGGDAVPEPSTATGLLGLIAAGLLLRPWRRSAAR